jgi:hypothetical protein
VPPGFSGLLVQEQMAMVRIITMEALLVLTVGRRAVCTAVPWNIYMIKRKTSGKNIIFFLILIHRKKYVISHFWKDYGFSRSPSAMDELRF